MLFRSRPDGIGVRLGPVQTLKSKCMQPNQLIMRPCHWLCMSISPYAQFFLVIFVVSWMAGCSHHLGLYPSSGKRVEALNLNHAYCWCGFTCVPLVCSASTALCSAHNSFPRWCALRSPVQPKLCPYVLNGLYQYFRNPIQ